MRKTAKKKKRLENLSLQYVVCRMVTVRHMTQVFVETIKKKKGERLNKDDKRLI